VSRDWREQDHPRWPAHAPDSRGGQFSAAGSHLVLATTVPNWAQRVSQRLAGGYTPGAWTQAAAEDYPAKLRAELRQDLPDEVIDQIYADYDWPAAVWENGQHRVVIHSPEFAGQAPQVLAYLDQLQARFPVEQSIRLSIVPASTIGGDRGVAVPGAGILYLSEESFGPWTDRRRDFVMPAGRRAVLRRRVPQWQYAMTHEWGHLVVPHHPGSELMRRNLEKHLSHYGNTAWYEANAEAFAEWYLSQGRSRNLAAQAYAAWLGWRWE